MTSQRQRAERFRDLHQGPGMLVLPNPWDAGSAKMLASLGFDALATTSAGLAFSLGRRDAEGAVSRTEALENARAIVAATDSAPARRTSCMVARISTTPCGVCAPTPMPAPMCSTRPV